MPMFMSCAECGKLQLFGGEHKPSCSSYEPVNPYSRGTSDAPDSPSTGLETLSDSELARQLDTPHRFGYEKRQARFLIEAARRLRLRVTTGLSDAEILERAADVLSERYSVALTCDFLRRCAENLRSEQNAQKPTKEKDANGI